MELLIKSMAYEQGILLAKLMQKCPRSAMPQNCDSSDFNYYQLWLGYPKWNIGRARAYG